MTNLKKSFLPEKSRKIIGDILLYLIFMMVFFGLFYLVSGAAAGLEPGESRPFQYYAAAVGESLPILAGLLKRSPSVANRVILGAVWAAAAAGAGFLLHFVVNII